MASLLVPSYFSRRGIRATRERRQGKGREGEGAQAVGRFFDRRLQGATRFRRSVLLAADRSASLCGAAQGRYLRAMTLGSALACPRLETANRLTSDLEQRGVMTALPQQPVDRSRAAIQI